MFSSKPAVLTASHPHPHFDPHPDQHQNTHSHPHPDFNERQARPPPTARPSRPPPRLPTLKRPVVILEIPARRRQPPPPPRRPIPPIFFTFPRIFSPPPIRFPYSWIKPLIPAPTLCGFTIRRGSTSKHWRTGSSARRSASLTCGMEPTSTMRLAPAGFTSSI